MENTRPAAKISVVLVVPARAKIKEAGGRVAVVPMRA